MRAADYLKRALCIIMAGGKGERLYPLTKDRAKPATPFGGIYRIIDFTLSNCLNSNIRRIYVLTQYRSVSLDRHIRQGWSIFNHELGEFIECIPPQMRHVDRWYRGTADSIFQNIYLLQRLRPEWTVILSGDHLYKMDYSSMIEFHARNNAELTIAGVEVDRMEATRFGVIGCDDSYRITSWKEKPSDPVGIPGKPDKAFVSMGIYVFNTEVLVRNVIADAKDSSSDHDFGKNVIPKMVDEGRVFVHRFHDATDKESQYWRDIGTIDAYYEANMDLTRPDPELDLYDPEWPMRTYQGQSPPAKIVSAPQDAGAEMVDGSAVNSILAGGCIVSGGRVDGSVLSARVRVGAGAVVENSVLLEGVQVGPGARIRDAIIDRNVTVPGSFAIGYDRSRDEKLFTISPGGVVIAPKRVILQ